MRSFFLCFSLLLALPLASQDNAGGTASLPLTEPDELRPALESPPCRNEERLAAVKELFLQMGASEADITIEKSKEVENLIIRKPGATDEKIIIGAHYDLTGEGSCGAVDNWTGIVAIAHIYKSLKDLPLQKTLLFVGFGKEEEGLVGSRAMAKQITKEMATQYCAMVNVDGIGLTTPQALANVSSKKLTKRTKELAKTLNIPFEMLYLNNASSDSASFQDKKIPAISIVGMSRDWGRIYHSSLDRVARVNPNHVYLSYKLALFLVKTLDESACGAYR